MYVVYLEHVSFSNWMFGRIFVMFLSHSLTHGFCSHQEAPERAGVPRGAAVLGSRVEGPDAHNVLRGERGPRQRRFRPRKQEGLLHETHPPRAGHVQDQGGPQCKS